MSPDGALPILKPPGMTSHDVVAVVRRLYGLKRVGHTGTLDPSAAGVLGVCLGQATRLVEYLQAGQKVYRAVCELGRSTTTQDADGETVAEFPVEGLDPARVRRVFEGMTGPQEQRPPLASAVKVRGRPLYEWQHRGRQEEAPDRPLRRVLIHSLEVRRIEPGSPYRVEFDVTCSPGTYIRTLCQDAGERLGVGGHLHFLLRLRTGPFRLEEALTLEEVEAAGRREGLLWDLNRTLGELPVVRLGAEAAGGVRHGRPPAAEPPVNEGSPVRLVGPTGELLAVARYDAAQDRWRLEKVLV